MLNTTILIGTAFVRLSAPRLAYELGSIYAGVIIGTCFTFLAQSIVGPHGKSPFEALRIRSQARKRFFVRGTKKEYIAIIGMTILFGIMVIVEGNSFFGNRFYSNIITSVVIMAVAGALYAMVLLGLSVWFDYWIWRGELIDYAIASLSIIFLLSMGAAFSYQVLKTSFFVVGLVSRAISSIIVHKSNRTVSKVIRISFYVSILFILLLPFVFRL